MPRRAAVLVAVVVAGVTLPLSGAAHADAAVRTTPQALLKKLSVQPASTSWSPSAFSWGMPSKAKCASVPAQVLVTDALGPTPRHCSEVGLVWKDPLTGSYLSQASKVTAARFVPEAEVYFSGASAWTQETFAAYSNDLGFDGTLVAASRKALKRRDSRDPVGWLPAEPKARCAYAVQWIAVKYRWRLSVDPAEKKVLIKELARCATVKIRVPKRAPIALHKPPVPVPVLDQRYDTCAQLAASQNGPYLRGRDPEYAWYRDDDNDGIPCETEESIGLSPSRDWQSSRYVRTKTPTVNGLAVPVAGPEGWSPQAYLQARILNGGTEIWRGTTGGALREPAIRAISVPDGVLGEGTYTVQVWSTFQAYAPDDPVSPLSMTFIVDLTHPPLPTVSGTASSANAVSHAEDIAAIRFTYGGFPEDVPARPGQVVAWSAPYMSGPPLDLRVQAIDRAGNPSSWVTR